MTAVILCAALLISIPFLFRAPMTSFRDPLAMAVHAYQLSLEDEIGGNPAPPGLCAIPPRGPVAFGSHRLYPLMVQTARDTSTGDVLMRISVPGGIRALPPSASWNGLDFDFAAFNGGFAVLVSGDTGSSWPKEAWASITGR
ncbi:MAG: hypothetical protein AVO35_08150 [Candidatus Aegiribacteria sp. MLS_C]|nr:MAG: hypothetical protein AVO35_08150 [Candidatus Aegiribacteria sp. MLS_C]